VNRRPLSTGSNGALQQGWRDSAGAVDPVLGEQLQQFSAK
jgi:hypothetical protein